ncbi:hypothetical protein ABMA27_016331 [Loxostege sticticalis]|uniref:CHK kinase-like domain-containing protein n=1 Tax=Loxostege sticticalis TaxID=481309 RepID=A0ABR3I1V4_LOXSC
MVGGDRVAKQYKLEDVLTEEQVQQIVKAYVPDEQWTLVDYTIKPASDGLSGFMGDHLKISLNVKLDGQTKAIPLFIKRMPQENKPKADFIENSNFFRREMTMFQLFDKIRPTEEGPNPWCTKALISNESLIVLPDLNVEGYSPRPHDQTLDLAHVLVTTASVARFHAAFTNYEVRTGKELNQPCNFSKENEQIMKDFQFVNSFWLSSAAKLSANFLKSFSKKAPADILNLEEKFQHEFLEACDSMKYYDDTLNVLLHKDLWVNNIMFRYEKGVPANAILIDFQCIRYGPPSFDMMVFLYLSTSKSFREQHEREVLLYYYRVFSDSLDDAAKLKVKELGFDREEFLRWCERGRMFGMCVAAGILRYTLMDPVVAKKTFDNPDTFDQYVVDPRIMLEYANQDPNYKNRLVELAEEFAERYIVNKL